MILSLAALQRNPLKLLNIPLNAGMSIGVLLICVELIMMIIIFLFVPREYAGASFIGFAVGESLGASVLRIAGGIFTKIAGSIEFTMLINENNFCIYTNKPHEKNFYTIFLFYCFIPYFICTNHH